MKKRHAGRSRKTAASLKTGAAAGLVLLAGLWGISGCSSGGAPGAEQRELTPYSLCGGNGDWDIRCEVRELTADEKDALKAEWEQSRRETEELPQTQELSQADREKIGEAYERLEQKLTEEPVYVSVITGTCRNPELDGKTFDYQLTGGDGQKVIAGTQTVSSSEDGLWYRSFQAASDAEAGLFIPPLQTASMVIRFEGEETAVPLELSVRTENG